MGCRLLRVSRDGIRLLVCLASTASTESSLGGRPTQGKTNRRRPNACSVPPGLGSMLFFLLAFGGNRRHLRADADRFCFPHRVLVCHAQFLEERLVQRLVR